MKDWDLVNKCQELHEKGLTQSTIAKELLVSRSTVSHCTRIARLNPKVKNLAMKYQLALSLLRPIATLTKVTDQLELIKEAFQKQLGISEIQSRVEEYKKAISAEDLIKQPLLELSTEVTHRSGLVTLIKDHPKKQNAYFAGITLYNKEELLELVRLLSKL